MTSIKGIIKKNLSQPITYGGYSEDNMCRISVEADSAKDYINPDDVYLKIEELINTINMGFKNIANRLSDVKISEDVLLVNDQTMQPIVDELAEQIGGKLDDNEDISPLAQQLEMALQNVYDSACDAYETKQAELNKGAIRICEQDAKVAYVQVIS